jgi:hypothetical protein
MMFLIFLMSHTKMLRYPFSFNNLLNHDILLAKLELYDIKNTPLMLFKSFLSDRSQQCQVNGGTFHIKIPKIWSSSGFNFGSTSVFNLSMIYRTVYNTLQHVCSPTILTLQFPVNQLRNCWGGH